MLDINFIRGNQKLVEEGIKTKGIKADIGKLLEVDDRRRKLLAEVEDLRAKRNKTAQERDIEQGKELKEKVKKVEEELEKINSQFHDLMLRVPNVPAKDVPVGKDETENKVIRKWGEPRNFDFKIRDHLELGEALDIIDVKTASKVVGTRFNYLKGAGVLLEFALINFALKVLTDEKILKEIIKKVGKDYSSKSFVPVVPPAMIRPEVYTMMARLDPQQEEERYFLPKDKLYLIGSAEHTLGPMHIDQIISDSQLPIRYIGFSTNFRREAGSYGKDTRGILRVHQFDKLEAESFTLPDDSDLEQEFIVAIQEYLMQSLKIPYQVVKICTGDMGAPDYRQIDIEAWLPSEGKYRETHTSDLMTDYQARRLNTRVKRKDGRLGFVHMNDATIFAIGRTIIAILENYQQKDGTVKIPDVLQKFVGINRISSKTSSGS